MIVAFGPSRSESRTFTEKPKNRRPARFRSFCLEARINRYTDQGDRAAQALERLQ